MTGARRSDAQAPARRPAQKGSAAERFGRWGLVLGGGGVLGGAWTVGALAALRTVHGLDPRDAELIVGTSAGSVTATLLAAGADVADLVAHQLGEPVRHGPLARVHYDSDTATGSSAPPRPRWTPGNAGLLTKDLARLRRLPPTAVLAALMPEGRGSLAAVGALADAVAPDGWPAHPGLRLVAMDLDTGRRTVFGDPQAPSARIGDAVMASCAIPGWYAPVVIDGHRFVDGGACSSTNVDLMAGHGLDTVFVIAPMVSFATDRPGPGEWQARAERQWRARVTRRCLREVAKVHRDGAQVTVLGPGPEDLQAIGFNLMAVERRTQVLRTSLGTSARALADPEVLDTLPDPVSHAEQDLAG